MIDPESKHPEYRYASQIVDDLIFLLENTPPEGLVAELDKLDEEDLTGVSRILMYGHILAELDNDRRLDAVVGGVLEQYD